ncbi:hypothetical protein [Sigmofec virus UA08Rod_4687]|uniref:Uncharacterized protein n=1 Tax=Sigmofec virus UA08Rod_4687 TaxID=2929407 RepID=A0A976N0Z3_9VIRU|nr:hypothetical protein [Sigmofec virus UA08Rod_4687]
MAKIYTKRFRTNGLMNKFMDFHPDYVLLDDYYDSDYNIVCIFRKQLIK